MVSLGKAGPQARFISRNDNISLSLFETGAFRAGAVGRIVFPRDEDDSDDLTGLEPTCRWGGRTRRLRRSLSDSIGCAVRGEVRQGVRAHEGVVGRHLLSTRSRT